VSVISPSAQLLIDSDLSVRQHFAINVHYASAGKCELSALIDQSWLNGAGFLHGGVAYALMDSACAYACASSDVRGVTTNGNITYVKGGRSGTTLLAVGKVVSQSRRVMSLTAEVSNAEGQLLAHGSFVFQLIAERS